MQTGQYQSSSLSDSLPSFEPSRYKYLDDLPPDEAAAAAAAIRKSLFTLVS